MIPCVCGHKAPTYTELRVHRRGCISWKGRLGVCESCERGHYRHKKGCPNINEDDRRARLLQKHGIDLGQFERFLRVLSKHYKRLARIHFN